MSRYVVSDRAGNVLYESKNMQQACGFLHCSKKTFELMINYPLDKDDYVVKEIHEYVYTIVTDDKYEFPIGIYDSVTEMARTLNTTVENILSSINHAYKRGYNCRYKKIYIGEDE